MQERMRSENEEAKLEMKGRRRGTKPNKRRRDGKESKN